MEVIYNELERTNDIFKFRNRLSNIKLVGGINNEQDNVKHSKRLHNKDGV